MAGTSAGDGARFGGAGDGGEFGGAGFGGAEFGDAGYEGAEARLAGGGPGFTGAERGRGPGRRLSETQRAAEFGELTREQFLFVKAIDAFKTANGVAYPSWTDVLEVVRLLGYRKTLASELTIRAAEDWRERADAPSAVRPFGWERRFEEARRLDGPGGTGRAAA